MEKLYTFTEYCETGIPFIDDGHEQLFKAMKDGVLALSKDAEGPATEAVNSLLAIMEDKLFFQFLVEEAYLIQRRDPELDLQRKAHAAFRKEFTKFQKANDTADSKYRLLDNLMMYLHRWISQHILHSDAMIGKMPGEASAKDIANAKRSLTTAQKKWNFDAYAALAKLEEKGAQSAENRKTAAPKEPSLPDASEKPVKAAAPAERKKAPSPPPPAAARQSVVVKNTGAASADPFAFTAEFRTNIPLVDEEHANLFDLIRRTNDIVQDHFMVDKFDAINEILEELRDYTVKHFDDEERYMAAIGYEGLPEQEKAHRAFVEKISNIQLDDLDENQDVYLNDLITFLLKWLVQHILKVDKKIPAVDGVAENFS
ncbi:hypothetical protein TAMA11512_05390 [Selenomonas sp. TAMA-11512]|uniref:bacteriohemerythrin n=1 Tax=Selenomonas sp. TAMA-11512 TaxID=3095337 RepID=UPI003093D411|nr:hypothetical protein TAMA11512_05390 [Selenomonas sp. TAMA-11512]